MPAPSVLPGRANDRITRKSRLLFHWRAADLSLTPVTGETPTFVRATGGGMVADARGYLHDVAQYQPRFEMADLDGDGVRETPGLLLEGQRTNRALYSDDFSSWSKSAGTLYVYAAPDVVELGDLTIHLLTDTGGGSGEYFYEAVTFVGDGVKALAVHMKQGTVPPAAGTLVKVRDITAATDRLVATVTWVAGVPSVAMTTGSYVGAEALGNGVYRLLFATTAVTAANTNWIQFVVRNSVTGNVYAGGVLAEDAAFPSSPIKTAGAAVTRNTEVFSCAINLAPQSLTLYARFRISGWLDVASTGDEFYQIALQDAARTNTIELRKNSAAYQVAAVFRGNGGSFDSSGPVTIPAATATLEWLAQYDHAASTLAYDPGTGVLTTKSLADKIAANLTLVYVGGGITGTFFAHSAMIEAKVAAGVRSLAQIRESF